MQQELSGELTGDGWPGLPLCRGSFGGSGVVTGVVARADTVIVWAGGRSEVTIQSSSEPTGTARHRFQRYSGMIDLLPAGTVLEHIEWKGQRSSCVSALLPLDPTREPPARGTAALTAPLPLRFGLIDAHVVDLVRRLEHQALHGQPLGAVYTEALSLALSSYLSSRYCRASDGTADDGSLFWSQRAKLVDFIEARLAGDISLAEMASETGYSPDHFSRLFKRCFGESPYQYVLRRRVERVKAMLRDPSRSLADIATACGFASQAHLNTVFRRRTGLTPGAYRRG